MKTTLKIMTYIGKACGILAGLNYIPFIPQEYGLLVFACASFVKDSINRLGDILDDGKENKSFKVE